jgi:hypothetical protein
MAVPQIDPEILRPQGEAGGAVGVPEFYDVVIATINAIIDELAIALVVSHDVTLVGDGTAGDPLGVNVNNTLPSTIAPDAAGTPGAADTFSRSDHSHPISAAIAVAITDSTNSEGVAGSFSRSDHLHAHGNRGGGALHALAVAAGAAGFMSGADKSALDNLAASVFSSQFQFAESLATSTTTSAAYVEKLKLTTPAIPAGNYLIQWSADIGNTAVAGQVAARCQVDDATTLTDVSLNSGMADHSFAGHAVVALGAGVHFVDIDWLRPVAVGSASISNARLMLWRVS